MSEATGVATEPRQAFLASPQPVAQEKKRVLLTGAGGMLGADLSPALAGAGYQLFARPRSDLDITRPDEVEHAFRETRPEVVVNCAAFTKVDASEWDPRAFEVNAAGVRLLAEACRSYGAQLIQLSTDFVFDGESHKPYREGDPTAPLSVYGQTKAISEEAALSVPSGLVVRTSWLFGLAGWNFVEAILKQVEQGKRRLSVVNDQRGRPTATTDLAEAVLALLTAGAVGIYHFANAGEASWYDFAREILRLSKRADVVVEPVTSASLGRAARRPAYSVLDTGRYEKVTGRAIRDFREPLAEYLAARVRPEA